MRKEEVDLESILQSALAAIRPVLRARGHELSVTVEPGTFRVDADAMRLEQVMVNLRVRDSGRGIPRDMLERVVIGDQCRPTNAIDRPIARVVPHQRRILLVEDSRPVFADPGDARSALSAGPTSLRAR